MSIDGKEKTINGDGEEIVKAGSINQAKDSLKLKKYPSQTKETPEQKTQREFKDLLKTKWKSEEIEQYWTQILQLDEAEKHILVTKTMEIEGKLVDIGGAPLKDLLHMLTQIEFQNGMEQLEKDIVKNTLFGVEKEVGQPEEYTVNDLFAGSAIDKNPALKNVVAGFYSSIYQTFEQQFPTLSPSVKKNMLVGAVSWFGDVCNALPSSELRTIQKAVEKTAQKIQTLGKNPNFRELASEGQEIIKAINSSPRAKSALDRIKAFQIWYNSNKNVNLIGDGSDLPELRDPLAFKQLLGQSQEQWNSILDKSHRSKIAFKKSDLQGKEQQLKAFLNNPKFTETGGMLGQVRNLFDQFKDKQEEFKGMIEEMSGDVLGWKQMLISIGLWETFKGMADGVLSLLGYKNGFKGFEQNLIEKQLAEGEHKMTQEQKQQLRRTTRDYSTNFLAAKNGSQFDPNTIYGIKAQLLDNDKKEYEKNLYFHEPSLKREIQKILDGQKNGKNLIDKSAQEWLEINDFSDANEKQVTDILLKKIEQTLRDDPELMEKLMKSKSLTEGDHASAGALALTMLMKGPIGAEAYKVDTPSIYGLIDNATPVEQADGTQESDFKLSESDFDQEDFGVSHEVEKPEQDIEKIKKNYEKLKNTDFNTKLTAISKDLGIESSNLYTIIALETGNKFTSSVQNKATQATGLIQFMPDTAAALWYGKKYVDLKKNRKLNESEITNKKQEAITKFATMNEVKQLDYVKQYLEIYKDKIRKDDNNELGDLYMAVFYPKFIGQPLSTEFPKEVYNVNKGLDKNKDKKLTVGDVHATIKSKYNTLFSGKEKTVVTKNIEKKSPSTTTVIASNSKVPQESE